ncbi:ankyrin repeat domain-containing protein [Pyxidicoccus sp. MSG2]|uniref:ankyrin repeat domain-containing protein n=1 Tax=Pyxidicoccus sp. MSG2 TaxID=2996790 RepID=UPI00226EFA9D|nr:ankyrin repeat domain-containing protein [Pyxidicoccus sp. MSG2]MCY1019465.1 ankryin [Pyxidicoccus sp. MSG2]
MSTNAQATQALLSLCEDQGRRKAELSTAVRDLLSQGADVNARGNYGSTPLHFAVLAPYQKDRPLPDIDGVKALLDAGADPNARDDHAQTPLLRALPDARDDAAQEQRALELIHLLRAAGAKVPPDVKDSRAAAFRMGSQRLYQQLLDAGAPIDVRDNSDSTPLHRAAANGFAPIAELLLARGAEVNALDGLGRTPLGAALRKCVGHSGKPHGRTPEYAALIALLERAGGQPRVDFARSEDPFAPFPIDTAALKAAAPNGQLSFEHEIASAQEFATGLHSSGEPEESLAHLEALRSVLDAPPRHVRLQGPLILKRPFFHHGDLEVDGHLDIDRPFAVTGNLIVHGVLRDNGNDSLVNVLGDVRCHALHTDGEFSVRGAIHARDVVLGYYNDHLLWAASIHARVVIEDEHAISAEVHAEHHFDISTYQQGYGKGVNERLRSVFVDDVFEQGDEEEPGQLDNSEVFDRIRKGLPVFRERP